MQIKSIWVRPPSISSGLGTRFQVVMRKKCSRSQLLA